VLTGQEATGKRIMETAYMPGQMNMQFLPYYIPRAITRNEEGEIKNAFPEKQLSVIVGQFHDETMLTVVVILLILCVIYINRSDGEAIIATTVPIQLIFFPQTLIWGLTILIFPLTLAWNRAGRAGVFIVWLLGWVSAFGLGDPGWWKTQIILLSTAVLVLWLIISMGSAERVSIDKASDVTSSFE